MVSPTQSSRPPPPNPLDRSAAPSLDPLPRIPDYVRRPGGAGSPDTPSHTVQLPGTASAKPPGAQSPPRPSAPSHHSNRSASSISATAGTGQAQAGGSQGAGERGRGGYPPLPSAFARENPYSPAWPLKARQSDGQGPGTPQSAPGAAGSPPQSHGHGLPPTQQHNTTPSSSFGGYSRVQSTQQHAQPSHQHSQSAQSQAPPQPPRQAGSPYAPSHPWGAPSAQPAAQQQPPGADYYSRAGYGQSGQHSTRPSVPSQKSDPSSAQKQQTQSQNQGQNQSPRFGSTSTMPGLPTAAPSSSALYGQQQNNGHHQDSYNSRQASEPVSRGLPPAAPVASSAAPNGHPTANGHKRRRSELAAPVRQPPTAPFSLAQQRQAEIRPPLLKVDSAPVLAAVPAPEGGRAHLGRKVYCPFTDPAQLLSGDLLKNGVGGVVEVAVPVGCLEGARWQLGDPEQFTGKEAVEIPAEVWELEGLRKRKVWGTDIYTDDSDVVGIALHSGWLRLRPASSEPAADDDAQAKVQTLLLKLLVTPALVRYQGCTRQGLRSRSWGNGHEGVSLMVVGVEGLKEAVRGRGRGVAVRRVGEGVREVREELKELETESFVLRPWGVAGEGKADVAMEA